MGAALFFRVLCPQSMSLIPFSFLFFAVLIFLLSSRAASEEDDEPKYAQCSRRFVCGDRINVTYPFWGGDRPKYCGLAGFELSCQIGNTTSMNFEDQRYTVLGIDQTNRTISLARDDLLYLLSPCQAQLQNTTIYNHTNLTFPSSLKNLSIFYDCYPNPMPLSLPSNMFNCLHLNGLTTQGFFGEEASLKRKHLVDNCRTCINVPVLQSTLDEIEQGKDVDLLAILNHGFEVKYNLETPRPKGENNITPNIYIGLASVIGPVLFGSIILFLSMKLRYGICSGQTSDDTDIENFINLPGSLAPKRFSYSVVKRLTSSFEYKLGEGGFGTVYKGKLPDGTLVAVKLLKTSNGNGEEFINEVASISRTSHVNIVTLLGYCFEGHKRALIYEYMSNGSLDRFLSNRNSTEGSENKRLEWDKLYQISIGIASGLEYLHRGCNTRILHFDIKPQNILLDDKFCPKISDFGLSKLCLKRESIVSMLVARGTIGYIAPEVFCRSFGEVSHKSDVYSYGMMLIEMVGGKKQLKVYADRSSEMYFHDQVYRLIEPSHNHDVYNDLTEEDKEIARKMAFVGVWCIQIDPKQRPHMSSVIDMLEGRLEALPIPPKPVLCPPRSPMIDSSATTESD